MDQLALIPVSAAADYAKHKAVIELAAKIRDWQTLLFAVEDMIADQRDFVAWWDEHVRANHRPSLTSAAEQELSMEGAEQLTGVKNWQVSRWRTALADEDAYRDRIIDAAQRKAGFSKDPSAERGQPLRDGPDFWPTPDSLIRAARDHVKPALPEEAVIWECACGDGRLGHGLGGAVMTDKYPLATGHRIDQEPLDFLVDGPMEDTIAFTNPPFNAADDFLKRGLQLLDAGEIQGLVLLLRHDHFMASGKVEALNRATLEVHCNWRPTWIPDTTGNPRWAFAWVYWGDGPRQPPRYLREDAA